ncbi:unnamed protein product [Cyprideis torosa]|uniref:Uncharacterized protein n=1 Tax=Cyprideis torosa TaxID=163714 RepID=A0A7R8WKN4_9CRUS|nr:unnamed protein product [Cyprideis torosa]CAG0900662.1 unnamed protein product [Cyprideis torosa]
MAEGKLADDIQDPRLEEPVDDTQCKENISPSEQPSVPLTSSEERKRKRQGTKIPKRSKAVKALGMPFTFVSDESGGNDEAAGRLPCTSPSVPSFHRDRAWEGLHGWTKSPPNIPPSPPFVSLGENEQWQGQQELNTCSVYL